MPLEDNAAQPFSSHDWSAELARQIETEQQRLSLFLDSQRRQVDGIESTLAAQLGSLAGHLAARLEVEHQQAGERLAHQQSLLAARAAKLADENEQLELLRARTREQRQRLAEHFRDEPPAPSTPSAASADSEHWREKVQRVEAERDELVRKLVGLEQRLHSAGGDSGLEEEVQKLERRLQRTLDEVRDLKQRNAELEQKAATRIAAPVAAPDGPLDWETQKRMLLAALEAEDPTHDTRKQEHLTIDGTIRITDSIVQEKDREITELKQLLNEQSQSVGTVAIGAAALGGLLDSDEIIRQQRERLAQLQAEWEAKMRQAEIDISMERARLARERVELEDSQRSLEDQLQAQIPTTPENAADASKSQAAQRGRWLSRLGLRENG
ncbi:MAG TPA: hypothetical protein VHY20_15055 [Pirellulales bacterium]|nr:hypothetical protein [Pirellulales bacterium]